MAKVKITGHASGSGVFTITAPNSNTDRTITLPDASVTLGTDATKLPLAGGTMSGVLNMGTADTVSTNNKIVFGKAVTASQSYLPVIQQGSPDGAGVDLILATTSGTGAVRFFTGNSGTSGVPFANSNTEKLSILSDGRGLSQFTAKAWCRYSDAGTVSIKDSHNISSLTDNGVGRTSLNFSNNVANANYAAAVGFQTDTTWSSPVLSVVYNSSTVSLIKLEHRENSNYIDAADNSVIVFGD